MGFLRVSSRIPGLHLEIGHDSLIPGPYVIRIHYILPISFPAI